jgi:hypothetical protein
MASEATHIQQANRNQSVLDRLIADSDPASDWITVVAFYKAVHVVEAILASNESSPNNHSVDHKSRNHSLKTKYQKIWESYYFLSRSSGGARYLESRQPSGVIRSYPAFSRFLSHDKVLEDTLGIDLKQVEQEASLLLSSDSHLTRYGHSAETDEPSASPPSASFASPPKSTN